MMFDEPGFSGDSDDGADADAPALYTFVYCSRAADGVDDAEVDRLVEAARRHNSTCGMTGVLVFGSGVFFQWVEGPASEVRKLITNLQGDPRHHDIVMLDQIEEKRERVYPNWEMERVGPEDILEVLEDALESAEDQKNVAALKRILDSLSTKSLGLLK